MQKNDNRFKKLKLIKEKRKKENATELQKPNVEAEVYSNNKKVSEWEKKLKILIRFHSANKINHSNRGRKKEKKKEKNPKESTEQVKT